MSDLFTIDAAIAEGMGRGVTVGALSTPVAGGGTTAVLDQNRPQLVVGVPANVCIRPFRIAVQVQPAVATTDADETEIVIAVDSLGLWTGDGSPTNENPSNLRTDLDKGSACRVGSVFGNMTTTPGNNGTAAEPVLDLELAREVQTLELATAANQNLYLLRLLYEPDFPLFIVGPASLIVYFGGTVTAVGGFIQAQWVEGTTSQFLEAV